MDDQISAQVKKNTQESRYTEKILAHSSDWNLRDGWERGYLYILEFIVFFASLSRKALILEASYAWSRPIIAPLFKDREEVPIVAAWTFSLNFKQVL